MFCGSKNAGKIILAIIVFCCGVTAWADTIDQSFAGTPTAALTVGSCCSFGQTFTAGGSGTLTQVSLLWQVQGGAAQLQITSVAGGLPTSTILSSTQVAPGSYNLSQFISLPTNVQISSGIQYAIVVTPPAGTTVNLWGDVNAVYLGGQVWLTGDQGNSWSTLPFPSLFFQTAGIPAPGRSSPGGWQGGTVPIQTPPGPPNSFPFPTSQVPEPSTVVLLASGIAGLWARLRK